MNNILKVSLIVVAVLVIAGGLFFAGSVVGSFWLQRAFMRSADMLPGRLANPDRNAPAPNQGQRGQGFQGGQPDEPNGNGMPGQGGRMGEGQGNMPRQGGRMGQQGQGGGPDGGMGPDMGGGMLGQGGRMGQRQGGPGMGGQQNRHQTNLPPLTVDEAKKAAQDYVTALKIDGLELGEVLIFDTHAYVVVKETASGNGAFELVIDPVNKVAHPERGPNAMWNLKYGGVIQPDRMGRAGPGPKGPKPTPDAAATAAPLATPADVSADMPISQEEALQAAQTWLDTAAPGATAATDALKFYGYYTVKFSQDGKLVGILIVNGYNGQVFGHPWRGSLIEQPK